MRALVNIPLLILVANSASAAVFYATPDATSLEDTLKKARISAQRDGSSKVILREGTYRLERTLEFTEADSGIQVLGEPNKRVVLSGGQPIRQWEPYSGSIYRSKIGPDLLFRQIYASKSGKDLARPIRARSPNVGESFSIDNWDRDAMGNPTIATHDFALKKIDLHNPPELIAFRFWTQDILRVSGSVSTRKRAYLELFDSDRKRLVLKTIPSKKEGQSCFFENSLEFLDTENEWFYDRTNGYLYYSFPKGLRPESVTVTIPVLETLVNVDGAKNLSFENIIFEHTNWARPSVDGLAGTQSSFNNNSYEDMDRNIQYAFPAAFKAKNTQELTIKKSVFKNMGASGLELTSGTHDSLIQGNRFTQIAAAGIQVYIDIGDPLPATDDSLPGNLNMAPPLEQRSYGDRIWDNYVDHIGLDYLGASGIFASYAEKLDVAHNEVYDTPYSGISVGWGWTSKESALRNVRIRNNHVYRVVNQLTDGAGIYLLSKQINTVVTENEVHGIRRGMYWQGSTYFSGPSPHVALYFDNEIAGVSSYKNSCWSNADIKAELPGVFIRAESKKKNSVQACKKLTLSSPTGPRPRFHSMKTRE